MKPQQDKEPQIRQTYHIACLPGRSSIATLFYLSLKTKILSEESIKTKSKNNSREPKKYHQGHVDKMVFVSKKVLCKEKRTIQSKLI